MWSWGRANRAHKASDKWRASKVSQLIYTCAVTFKEQLFEKPQLFTTQVNLAWASTTYIINDSVTLDHRFRRAVLIRAMFPLDCKILQSKDTNTHELFKVMQWIFIINQVFIIHYSFIKTRAEKFVFTEKCFVRKRILFMTHIAVSRASEWTHKVKDRGSRKS